MIEGRVEIAGYEFAVQDEQLMVYVPWGEGNSEEVTAGLVKRLAHLTGLVATHYEQMTVRRDFYPYLSLKEKMDNNE